MNAHAVRVGQPSGRFDKSIDDDPQIECRAAGRGLLLPDLVQFVGEPRDFCFLAGRRQNGEDAQPLAQRGSCALLSFDVAL